MRKILPYLLLVLSLTLACKTADKALDSGNYDKAYKLSMKALKKEKSVKENKSILEKSLKQIIKREQVKITAKTNSKDLNDWDDALSINLDLQEKIENASNYIGNVYGLEYDQLEKDYHDLRNELSVIYYNLGIEDLDKAIPENDKLLAQDAYFHFIKSEDYGNQSSNLDSLKSVSLEAGLLVYVVEADASFDYNWEVDRRFRDIESYSDSFHKVIYDRGSSDADCGIEISFGRIDVYYDEDSQSRTFQESVLVGTETQVDTAGNETEINVYETVEGTVYTLERKKFVRWEARVDIRSYTNNCGLSGNTFQETITSEIEEYQYDGDERAIPDRYRRNARSAEEFRDTDDMAEDLLEELYREIVRSLF